MFLHSLWIQEVVSEMTNFMGSNSSWGLNNVWINSCLSELVVIISFLCYSMSVVKKIISNVLFCGKMFSHFIHNQDSYDHTTVPYCTITYNTDIKSHFSSTLVVTSHVTTFFPCLHPFDELILSVWTHMNMGSVKTHLRCKHRTSVAFMWHQYQSTSEMGFMQKQLSCYFE